MIVITGEIEFHPEDAWPAMSAALAMMESSAAEDGCFVYRFYADILNPRRFRVYEEWRDEAALQAHFRSPHMAVFQEKLGKLRVLDRRLYRMSVDVVASLGAGAGGV
ncbi:antibiotic biosynthesis monooxygenase [Pikeienuella piscinae]|uniref:Antibiotic biosynthesis monooxygenase n=1 Tax=Pikeienuella piscinae TaxID=2748098 RepID=A0A7L5BUW6_9RHOB|nr:putative quinol monooxygenase [Pikeienuella piscinae]QIE54843.1 antibiotic biosynthesis monooxygenase [Pikeienuella piscinae]